jgi:hypothetical protein
MPVEKPSSTDIPTKCDQVAKKESEFEEQQAAHNQPPQRHWTIPIIVIICSAAVTGASLIRPIVNPPHDLWVVAIGIAGLIVGIAVGLYKLSLKYCGTKTIITFAVFFIMFDGIVAYRWTDDYWASHTQSPQVPSKSFEAQHFSPPRFQPDIKRFTVSFANDVQSMPALLCNGLLRRVFRCKEDAEVDMVCRDGALSVNVQLFSQANKGPFAYLQDGRFFVDVPGWDWNWDDTAMEIVDEQHIPRLQVIYKTPAYIEVYGVFGDGPSYASCVLDTTGEFGGDHWPPVLTPIFKYPSERNLHVRE